MTSLNSRSVLHASSTPAPSVSSTDDEEYHGRNRMSTTYVMIGSVTTGEKLLQT